MFNMARVKLLLIMVLVFFVCLNTEAKRPRKKEIKKIEQLLLNQNYDQASGILEKQLEVFPEFAEYNFMMGVCYYYNNSCSPDAIKYLEKALGLTRKRKLIIEIKHYLGRALSL